MIVLSVFIRGVDMVRLKVACYSRRFLFGKLPVKVLPSLCSGCLNGSSCGWTGTLACQKGSRCTNVFSSVCVCSTWAVGCRGKSPFVVTMMWRTGIEANKAQHPGEIMSPRGDIQLSTNIHKTGCKQPCPTRLNTNFVIKPSAYKLPILPSLPSCVGRFARLRATVPEFGRQLGYSSTTLENVTGSCFVPFLSWVWVCLLCNGIVGAKNATMAKQN